METLRREARSPAPADAPRCTVCDGTSDPWMSVPGDWRRPDVDATYELYRCQGCGHGFLDPMPSLDEALAAHDLDTYFTHHDGETAVGRRPLWRRLEERLRVRLAWQLDSGGHTPDNVLRALRGARSVVEIGCGKGELGQRIVGAGHDYVGVEIDDAGRALAAAAGLEVVKGVAQEVPEALRDRRFDAVVAIHVLEHVTDLEGTAEAIRRLLEPGGRAIIEVPNNAAVGGGYHGPYWPWLDAPRHVQFFTGDSLTRFFERRGFRRRDLHYTGFTRQLSPEWLMDQRAVEEVLARRIPRPRSSGARHAWRLLARASISPAERRYDSVMIHAEA